MDAILQQEIALGASQSQRSYRVRAANHRHNRIMAAHVQPSLGTLQLMVGCRSLFAGITVIVLRCTAILFVNISFYCEAKDSAIAAQQPAHVQHITLKGPRGQEPPRHHSDIEPSADRSRQDTHTWLIPPIIRPGQLSTSNDRHLAPTTPTQSLALPPSDKPPTGIRLLLTIPEVGILLAYTPHRESDSVTLLAPSYLEILRDILLEVYEELSQTLPPPLQDIGDDELLSIQSNWVPSSVKSKVRRHHCLACHYQTDNS
ncbi:hypothetical protein E2C01_047895 [Portunus trituberculatus]|uniref:Uncharacterized protein n=1 Tax=Portunus trituberculatus TaxID=210409 RepID=A0A5B7G1R5_PORTR|nr:hypothetical protein [Portunus trituberculatus]